MQLASAKHCKPQLLGKHLRMLQAFLHVQKQCMP